MTFLISHTFFAQAAPEVFTNSFLVKLTGNHGHGLANEIAKRNGFENLGPVRLFSTFYFPHSLFLTPVSIVYKDRVQMIAWLKPRLS